VKRESGQRQVKSIVANNELKCPLCGVNEVEILEQINVKDIERTYKLQFGISIRALFNRVDQMFFTLCRHCDLRFFFPSVAGTEMFYQQLQKFPWYYLDNKEEYEQAARFIKESDNVLEIGCGKGSFAKRIATDKYTGLEFSEHAIEMSKREGIHVENEPIHQHAKNHQAEYEVVCLFQVLEHIASVYDFLENTIKCLKPGGLLIISVPSASSFVSMAVNNALNVPPHHVTWWSDKCLHSVSNLFGLELLFLEHEQLADVHKEWYARTVAWNSLNSLLRRPHRIIDRTLWGSILDRVATLMGKLYGMGISNRNMRPRGHSVTAVFKRGMI